MNYCNTLAIFVNRTLEILLWWWWCWWCYCWKSTYLSTI